MGRWMARVSISEAGPEEDGDATAAEVVDDDFRPDAPRTNVQTYKVADLFGEGHAAGTNGHVQQESEPSRCDVHGRFLSYAEGLAGICSWCNADAFRSLRGRATS